MQTRGNDSPAIFLMRKKNASSGRRAITLLLNGLEGVSRFRGTAQLGVYRLYRLKRILRLQICKLKIRQPHADVKTMFAFDAHQPC